MFGPMAKQLSLFDFQDWFPDEESCVRLLLDRRWPNGFVCPKCGSQNAVRLTSRAHTFACRDCGGQTSATAGTMMHRTKLPLRVPAPIEMATLRRLNWPPDADVLATLRRLIWPPEADVLATSRTGERRC